jgi:hypothetical protein
MAGLIQDKLSGSAVPVVNRSDGPGFPVAGRGRQAGDLPDHERRRKVQLILDKTDRGSSFRVR